MSTQLNTVSLHPIFRIQQNKNIIMARVCEITGKKPAVGNNVSFSNKKNKRIFDINLTKKRFYIPEEDRWVTLKVTANAIKVINKKGISVALKEAKEKGYYKN